MVFFSHSMSGCTVSCSSAHLSTLVFAFSIFFFAAVARSPLQIITGGRTGGEKWRKCWMKQINSSIQHCIFTPRGEFIKIMRFVLTAVFCNAPVQIGETEDRMKCSDLLQCTAFYLNKITVKLMSKCSKLLPVH